MLVPYPEHGYASHISGSSVSICGDAMNIRRKEFIAEIRRLKRELADVSGRLSELEELANPTRPIATIATIVPEENPFEEDENSFAAKVASGMSKIRMRR
jgi:hypothetical protein